MIAYDLETTNIKAGSPRPLYITAYGESPPIHYESEIDHFAHLKLIMRNNFLVPEFAGVKFVAWNGNNFDAYFIVAALLDEPDLIIKPYLTRSNALRGVRISMLTGELNDKGTPTYYTWEFLDGMAMLGLATVSLEKFLLNFAPHLPKIKGAVDFEAGEQFDPKNPAHREYAMRDSIGLYAGMVYAQSILLERFNTPLAVTMGGACIKIFKANIPEGIVVYPCSDEINTLIRDYVMRGGYCYCVQRYHGPVWKYDLNQAYAAAMREALLPAGNPLHTSDGVHRFAVVYIARVTAIHPSNKIPFYYRAERDGRLFAVFARERIEDTWLTSIEVDQLRAEGWSIRIHESYCWDEYFSMKDYVDNLEAGRMTCDGGPNGPIGTMYKMVGCHSYGKTVEQNDPVEFVIAATCPPGYVPYYADEEDPFEHVFFKFIDDQKDKDYHQPHIGAFVTAHVRMVVRRAALLNPDAWLYADTDCVVFSLSVTDRLPIDAKKYGCWKVEESGTVYRIIAKKVYAQNEVEGPHKPGSIKRSAKGMNVRKLTAGDFEKWFEGEPPEQEQVQRNNFLAVLRGAEMYRDQKRKGTKV